MLTELIADNFARLVRKMDPHSRLLSAWELKGGVSAQVTALAVEHPDGRVLRVVVRQHGAADLGKNARIAADEFRLLQILHGAGLATPAPLYLDESGEIFATPVLVLEYIDGKPEFAPSDLPDLLEQVARQLASIHGLDPSQVDLSFLPQEEAIYAGRIAVRPAALDPSIDEAAIRDALERGWPLARRNRPMLLHGDFWPGNVLWKNGRVAAVIDWEDAHVGDPVSDLANSRLEILWAFGVDAMNAFTSCYAAGNALDLTDLPYWDLCAALRPAFKISQWATDEAEKRTMRERHKLFRMQAFDAVAGS